MISNNCVRAVTVLLLGCLMSCSKSSPDNNLKDSAYSSSNGDPVVLIIKNREHPLSNEITKQLAKALEYAKIPFKSVDLALIQQELTLPESLRMICITTTELDELDQKNIEPLVEFVAGGNTLLFGLPVWDKRFGFLEGIKKDSDFSVDSTASEIMFVKNIFPDFKDEEYLSGLNFKHLGIAGDEFKENIEIIARSKNEPDYPVILENSVGLGNVIVFNTRFLYQKTYRGLLFSVMSRGLSGIPYPVANVSTIFLDDFPAPLYNEKLPPVDEEYDITHARFYTDVWWPDMKAFADTFNIDYSAVVAFNYNANVVPPFDFKEWELGEFQAGQKGSVWLARDVAESRHAMAFHGYNHFSFMRRNWSNSGFMVAAVQAAKKRWVLDGLGPLPVTYVPPNNEVDSTGLYSVKKGFPSLQYMSSLYIGEVEDGEGREFGPDPFVPGLFNYPRISSGFYNDANSVFEQNALYQHTGIWTHFVHPDDVFQIVERDDDEFANRNPLGLGWHDSEEYDYGLYELFRERITETKQRYPVIRFLSAKDAAPIVRDWTNATVNYSRNDTGISYVYQLNNRPFTDVSTDSSSFWFMHVNESQLSLIEKELKAFVTDYAVSKYWDGSLIQFSSKSDSLELPDFSPLNTYGSSMVRTEQRKALAGYRSYIAAESGAGSVTDTDYNRLEKTMAALNRNPGSKGVQEEVIKLALELERVGLAIKILEQRLVNSKSNRWEEDDIERLLTYFGWEGRVDDGWELLDELWRRNQNQTVIGVKQKAAERYGYPGEETRDLWLDREIRINGQDKKALQRYITFNQSAEDWPKTREYLKRLIDIIPHSDTLYAYAFQRSLWYDDPLASLGWLEDFPNSTLPQLKKFSTEVANLYAYSANNYTKALEWADYSQTIDARTKLDWLLQQRRYYAFINNSEEYIAEQPENDSLRTYVGEQLIFAGFPDRGYEKLYPLFKTSHVFQSTKKLIQTKIGYMSYSRQQKMYNEYPAFFSDSLRNSLQFRHRKNEGHKTGLAGSYASDNFNNTIAKIGLFADWGRRPKYTHNVNINETFVGSDINGASASNSLLYAGYEYIRTYREQSMQSTAGAGFYLADGNIRPNAKAAFWYAKDSTFTSGQLLFEPVLTNSAIRQTINTVKATFYREDFWWSGKAQTAASINGNRYSNDVFSYEGLVRLYARLPFSRKNLRFRGIAELSYSDATESFLSGIPYYTPDNLLIEGIGMEFRYRDIPENPSINFEFELVGKNDNRDGTYLTSAARFKAILNKYWEISLNAEISSSSVYRYNNVGFSISYIFPKKLNAQ